MAIHFQTDFILPEILQISGSTLAFSGGLMASKRKKKVVNQLAGQHAHGLIDNYPPYSNMRQKETLIPFNAHVDVIPRNLSQAKLIRAIEDENNHIIISLGYAGTGKTALCTRYALQQLVDEKIDKIIITRPTVESGDSLGFLPGDINEKMAPWVLPIFDIMTDGTGITKIGIEKLIRHGIIEIAPLQLIRGRTFKNTVIIADEMQNSDINQLKLLLTRIGENSKILITGDLDQSDRPSHKGKSGLEDFVDRVTFYKGDTSGIHVMKFDKKDIVRHEIIGKILDIYND
jgi:phosphate starvation-inducible protein PhoH and related proteins